MAFNIFYYKLFNDDIILKFNTQNDLLYHYNKHGQFEKRIINKKSFLEKYTDYNLEKIKNIFGELITECKNIIKFDENILIEKIYYTIKNFNTKFNCKYSNIIKSVYINLEKKGFNYIFYSKIYPDLKENNLITPNQLFNHWLTHGKLTNRKKNIYDLQNFFYLNLKKCNYNYLGNKKEEFINILIRTSNRPNDFKKCINSVLKQNYKNYNVIVCYDKIESEKYLNMPNIEKFFVSEKSLEKYKFNLYCNKLLDKTEKGWIIFLDDDKIFTNKNTLKIINNEIIVHNDIIIWDFLRPDTIVRPSNLNKIQLGQIDTSSFCFNTKYKKKSRWIDKQASDYYFFNKLVKSQKFNIKKIDKILVTTTYDDKVANFGY